MPVEQLRASEALGLVAGGHGEPVAPTGLALPPVGTPLRVNPLLEGGRTTPAWPSPRYAEEYGPRSGYLHLDRPLDDEVVARAATAGVGVDPVVDDLARRRVLVDLPARW